MATRLGSLNRLQWKQLSFSQLKNRLLGDILAVSYFWLLETLIFFLAKSDGMEFPPMLTSAVILGFLVPDIICKLIFENDITVMDSFLKTRPVPQELWDRFLAMSQLWKPSNLIIPLMLLPACFLFLPVLYGLIVFAALYLVSVFNGFVVMRIKHRGPYLSEKEVKSHNAGSVKSAKGNYISGLPLRSVMRLKKLRRIMILLTLMIYFQMLAQSMSNVKFGLSFAILYIFCLSSSILQYGFSVEANFFNALWTKPLAIEKLLEDKKISVVTPTLAGKGVTPTSMSAAVASAFTDNWDLAVFDVGGDSAGALSLGRYCRDFDEYPGTVEVYDIVKLAKDCNIKHLGLVSKEK